MKTLKLAGLVLGAFLIMALPASAAHFFRRGIAVAPMWGWYNPYYYAPYGWYGYYGPYPVYRSNMAELKLKTNVKDADVYINGAYAGKASKLKSMWLRPAAYNLEIRYPDRRQNQIGVNPDGGNLRVCEYRNEERQRQAVISIAAHFGEFHPQAEQPRSTPEVEISPKDAKQDYSRRRDFRPTPACS